MLDCDPKPAICASFDLQKEACNVNHPLRAAALMLFFLSAFGCTAHYAQSPEEWVYYHKQGTLLRGIKDIEVKRSKKAVEADLAEYVSKCVDGMITVSRLQQGMQLQVSKSEFTARLKPSEGGKTMLSIQIKSSSGPNLVKGAHPDGDFYFVSEIRQEGQNTTKITSYHLVASESFADEVKEWANGIKKNVQRPDQSKWSV